MKPGDSAIHNGKECEIVEVNYLGCRIRYDDDKLAFIPASKFGELVFRQETPVIAVVEDKRKLPNPVVELGLAQDRIYSRIRHRAAIVRHEERRRRIPDETVIALVKKVLARAKYAITDREIHNRIGAKAVVGLGSAYIGRLLVKHPQDFERVGKGGWTLRGSGKVHKPSKRSADLIDSYIICALVNAPDGMQATDVALAAMKAGCLTKKKMHPASIVSACGRHVKANKGAIEKIGPGRYRLTEAGKLLAKMIEQSKEV